MHRCKQLAMYSCCLPALMLCQMHALQVQVRDMQPAQLPTYVLRCFSMFCNISFISLQDCTTVGAAVEGLPGRHALICCLRQWHDLQCVPLQKLSAGSTILCTAEVESIEGRKLWMKSTVTDGASGKVYATARALFVAPSSTRLAKDALKFLKDGVFPPDRMGSSM